MKNTLILLAVSLAFGFTTVHMSAGEVNQLLILITASTTLGFTTLFVHVSVLYAGDVWWDRSGHRKYTGCKGTCYYCERLKHAGKNHKKS